MNIIPLFCEIDDFLQVYEKQIAQRQLPIPDQPKKRGCPRKLHTSEVMTLLVAFHQSRYQTFKDYYTKQVCENLRWAFPHLVSYNRFVELMFEAFVSLCAYLSTRFGECSGISFIDSTPIRVCHNRRIHNHRVFDGMAERSKTTLGWFYGFKLHLIINERGELLSVWFTTANTDDRRPVCQMTQRLFGKLYGDKGYISQKLRETLETQGVSLITKVRKNMKTEPLSVSDALMLKKRMLIETVIGQLKQQTELEHSRHRSVANFQVNLVCALIAYTHQPKKPSLDMRTLLK